MLVQRSMVHGRVGDVKTEYSRDSVPLDPALVEVLLRHKERAFAQPEGWVFANPVTDRPYHQEEIQKKHIRKPGVMPGSATILAGTRSGTATGRGWTKPGAAHRPKGVDAACQHSDHDERLREGHDGQ